MTALASELRRILQSGEVLQASSFPPILNAIGYGTERVEIDAVKAALEELLQAGHAKRESRRGRVYYRQMWGPAVEIAHEDGSGVTFSEGAAPWVAGISG